MAYEINLLHTQEVSRQLADITQALRTIAWYTMIALLSCGVLISSMYILMSSRVSALQKQRTQLITRLRETQAKEGILVSLKQRATTTSRALDAAKPWGKVFEIIGAIAPPDQFKTLTIDESGKVFVSFEMPSIDDSLFAVTNVLSLSRSRSIKSPELQELTMRTDGTVVMRIAIIPVFTL